MGPKTLVLIRIMYSMPKNSDGVLTVSFNSIGQPELGGINANLPQVSLYKV